MIEIKFRAWDEGNKVMHNNFQYISSGDEGNDWIIFISDKFTLENHDTNPFRSPSPYFSQQLKKMQYTGLKDKNGVEIYEGDIVNIKGKQDDKNYVVEFKNGGFGVQIGKNTFSPFIINAASLTTEIIGNIHEDTNILDI